MAPLAVIELVDRDKKAKGLDSGPIQKKKQESEIKSDENVAGTEEKKQDQAVDRKVPENELKDNQEISKKLDKKIEKPRNF